MIDSEMKAIVGEKKAEESGTSIPAYKIVGTQVFSVYTCRLDGTQV